MAAFVGAAVLLPAKIRDGRADCVLGLLPVLAIGLLAGRFGCSARQARRYVERAAQDGPTAVPEATTVFTVRLPAVLAARVRERARESGSTISALVVQALTEFLARGHRGPGRR